MLDNQAAANDLSAMGWYLRVDRNSAFQIVRVPEAAASASAFWTGKGDTRPAGDTEVEARRLFFYSIYFDPRGVEDKRGQKQTPVLYVGEIFEGSRFGRRHQSLHWYALTSETQGDLW